jgi:hypothetical protein
VEEIKKGKVKCPTNLVLLKEIPFPHLKNVLTSRGCRGMLSKQMEGDNTDYLERRPRDADLIVIPQAM